MIPYRLTEAVNRSWEALAREAADGSGEARQRLFRELERAGYTAPPIITEEDAEGWDRTVEEVGDFLSELWRGYHVTLEYSLFPSRPTDQYMSYGEISLQGILEGLILDEWERASYERTPRNIFLLRMRGTGDLLGTVSDIPDVSFWGKVFRSDGRPFKPEEKVYIKRFFKRNFNLEVRGL